MVKKIKFHCIKDCFYIVPNVLSRRFFIWFNYWRSCETIWWVCTWLNKWSLVYLFIKLVHDSSLIQFTVIFFYVFLFWYNFITDKNLIGTWHDLLSRIEFSISLFKIHNQSLKCTLIKKHIFWEMNTSYKNPSLFLKKNNTIPANLLE